jgi:mono/diheme cytochrome c family protein
MRTAPSAIRLAVLTLLLVAADGDDQVAAGLAPDEFFLERVRPVLVDQCWRCHGARKQRNGLRLDSREAMMRGGHTADVVPGHPETSRLIDAIGYEDGDLQMPPDAKLSNAEIAAITAWVRLGMPWPASSAAGMAGRPDGVPDKAVRPADR